MSDFEVELEVSQNHTFIIEDAEDAAAAIRRAVSLCNEGETAADIGWPGIEVRSVKVADREVRFVHTLDWGNKDERGFSRWKVTALGDRTSNALAEGHDVGEVANAALRAVRP